MNESRDDFKRPRSRFSSWLWPPVADADTARHQNKTTGLAKTISTSAIVGIGLLLLSQQLAVAGRDALGGLMGLTGVVAVCLGLIHTIRDIRSRVLVRRRRH